MILVSGTKRSGTSLWMQVLRAAGLPSIGDAFPPGFGERLRPMNPRGFFESPLRDGIHFDSNPDPTSGEYLHPADVRNHVVKVFTPGLTKTDLAFVDRVIVCVRDCASYVASMEALVAADKPLDVPALPHHLAWWSHTYGAVFDAMLRRYPVHFVSYARTLDDPSTTVTEVLSFVGGGNRPNAVAAIDRTLRHHPPMPTVLPAAHALHAPTFDRLYEALHEVRPIDDALRTALEETHLALADDIEKVRIRILEARLRTTLAQVSEGET